MRNHLFAAVAACLIPAAAFAGGYLVPNVNPRDLGMAGSAVAAQNTAVAVYVNPAALAGQDGLSLSVNGSLINFSSTWTDTTGQFNNSPVSMTPKAAFPPGLFASYGMKVADIPIGFGAGLNVPAGGEVFWPGSWPGRFYVTTVDRRVYGMYLTGGIQPIKQVKIGGGLIYYRTSEHLTQAINFLGYESGAELGTAGGKVSYDVSAEITPLDSIPLTFGIDYKHKADQTLTGHAHFDNVPAPLRPQSLDQPVSHELTIPNLLNIGASFMVLPQLRVTAAYTFDRYIVYRQDVFAGTLGTNVIVPRNYHNGYTLRLGGEFDVFTGLTVRAGVLRDIAPTDTNYLNPSIPDANSTAFSLGATYNVTPALAVNAAFFYDKQDDTTTTGPDTFQGQYSTHAAIYSLGITYRMGTGK